MDDPAFLALPFDQQVNIFNSQPALAAPDGVVPDYAHPRARNDVSVTVVVIGLTMTTVLFFLRIYARQFRVKKIGIADCKPVPSTYHH